ncbi:hypothetical protein, partial [Plesiomonas shigelloides]|uniref:hypothetical protein n=1 Tax=Plesiomonas shigelloides TaxID=703 RepID=UPI001E5F6B35
ILYVYVMKFNLRGVIFILRILIIVFLISQPTLRTYNFKKKIKVELDGPTHIPFHFALFVLVHASQRRVYE